VANQQREDNHLSLGNDRMERPSATLIPLPERSGLLLVGHGTRSQEGTNEFFELVRLMKELADGVPVEPALLELQRPNLDDGWQRLTQQGVHHVRVVPVLLWSAGHALRDLPGAIGQIAASTPGVSFDQTDVLGFHDSVFRRSEELLAQLLANHDPVNLSKTALVSVGRGSTENQATEDMMRFSELRALQSGFSRSQVGFVAMALPTLGSTLDQLGQDYEISTVIVQPHLLFAGDLRCTVCKMVRRAAHRYPAKQWLVTELLGPHRLIAEALLDRSGLSKPVAVV
jgi:sirohydrochlorin cobaltochelatase